MFMFYILSSKHLYAPRQEQVRSTVFVSPKKPTKETLKVFSEIVSFSF